MAAEASWPVIKDCFFSGGPGMAAEASWPVIGVAWNGRGGFVASSLLPGLSLDHLEIPQTSLRRAPQTKKWGLEGALLYQPLEEPWNQCL